MTSVLILGGYGNFGKRIASELVASAVPVVIAGRNQQKAEALAAELGELASPACFDVRTEALDAAAVGQTTSSSPPVVIWPFKFVAVVGIGLFALQVFANALRHFLGEPAPGAGAGAP